MSVELVGYGAFFLTMALTYAIVAAVLVLLLVFGLIIMKASS